MKIIFKFLKFFFPKRSNKKVKSGLRTVHAAAPGPTLPYY